ncbi:MAG: phytoene desaturase [Flavobacteriales bacterium]|nr:phytoene desaturase [Flavobacteriales bacterium]
MDHPPHAPIAFRADPSSRPGRNCAIVGAGFAGIAAAIRLARLGYRVTVFEANAMPGGKAAEWRIGPYRFDMGPTILTMPGYVDELFDLCGEDPRDHFNYAQLDPSSQFLFEDGTVVRMYADPERLADEFAERTTANRASVLEFLRRSKVKRELTDEVFLQRSLHRIRNYFNKPTLRGVLQFRKVEAFTSMARANAALFRDAKAAAIFNQYASYHGADPYAAPATLNLIAYYELALGSFSAKGGMHAVVKALVALAERQGVAFRFNTRVERILVERGHVRGVQVNNERIPFDLVVSNADAHSTYHRLLTDQPRPNRTLDQPRSSSVIVFYWGMDRTYPALQLNNLLMSGDGRAEYDHIFNKHRLFEDPSIYLHVSAKAHASDAPPGHENWFVMVSVPHNTGQDWDMLIRATRQRVVAKLERMLKAPVEPHIVREHVMDPRLVEELTSSAFGAIFGSSSSGVFASFLRHSNFSRKIKGLYFCGGSVHPGPSIPLCLLSAKITTDLIAKRERK